MTRELPIRIILVKPPPGVDFGIQKGKGNKYETVQVQRSADQDLKFEFAITVNMDNVVAPNFLGAFAQGPPRNRFIYIDIGTNAGQRDSLWSRRLKIPLETISSATINELFSDPLNILETKIPGTGKDGGPTCATVKPFDGWHLKKRNIIKT